MLQALRLVCAVDFSFLWLSPGIVFFLNGRSIPNNNMSRISVYDFQVVSNEAELNELDTSLALRCQFELLDLGRFTRACIVNSGDSPIQCIFPDPNLRVIGALIRGWGSRRGELDVPGGVNRTIYVWRREQTPEEGYFNCHNFRTDTNDPAGLYILYPSEWPSLLTVIERCSVLYHSSSPPVTEVTAAIEVVTGTSTFRVRCSSTGGRALDMAVSGPQYNSVISSSNIQPDGTRVYQGADSYTGSTDVISSGSDGDVYQCSGTSVGDPVTGTVTLRGN